MRTKSCKAKGRRLQQTIASDLLSRHPRLTPDDIRSTPMGAHGEDVQLSQAAQEAIPFSFEAKNQERVNVWAAIEQSMSNASQGRAPCVVLKKNDTPPFAVIPWRVFLDLLCRPHATDTSAPLPLAARLLHAQAAVAEAARLIAADAHEADAVAPTPRAADVP